MKSKPIVAVLGLALAVSGALNVILFRQADEYYRELNVTRLDPLGAASFAQAATPSRGTSKLRVVLFGDSRAQNWPDPGMADVQMINRGVGAQTSAQVLGRFEGDVAALEPDVVVVQVGINDLKVIGLLPEQTQSIQDACLRNIRAIVAASRNLGAKVIITTVIPSTGDVPLTRRSYWSDEIDAAAHAINTELRAMRGPNVEILDAATLLDDGRGHLRPDYASDLLHLNDAGYHVLNRALIEHIQAIQT